MTLDQAIQHCLDKLPKEDGLVMCITPYDSDHLQLAEWLTQLRTARQILLDNAKAINSQDLLMHSHVLHQLLCVISPPMQLENS